MNNGRAFKPSTNQDPLLKQLFDEQARLNVSTATLARISGIDKRALEALRHPSIGKGKRATIAQARQLAEALDFKWPTRLAKND